MKKVYLLEEKQHKVKSYVGVVSARELVRLATKEELNENEKFQRVINPSRLKEISEYVLNSGLLSGSIIIGTRFNDKLAVHKVQDSDIPNLYYTEFPETEEEFEEYKNSFDIMDGQHRLFSFLEEIMEIDESANFDLSFNMYITPTLREKRLIFKNTNQEQKPVPSNLLLWFRKKLDMFINNDEKNYYAIVERLNNESCSPLKGKIIMGDEKISGGFKAEQIIKIFKKVGLLDILSKSEDTDVYVKVVSTYLQGWELATKKKMSIKENEYAPYSKVSGLRFMMLLLPAIYNKAKTDRVLFTIEFVSDTLKSLFALKSMEPEDAFSAEYISKLDINPFAAETPTTEYADFWKNMIKELEKTEFDPLGY